VVAVVGAGPAGLSAALWLKQLRLRPVLIERADRVGGLLHQSPFPNPFLLGLPGKTGPELAREFGAHVQAEGLSVAFSTEVIAVAAVAGGLQVELRTSAAGASASGPPRTLMAAAMVLCTGTRFNEAEELLRVPGVEAARAAGVLTVGNPPAPEDTARWVGQRVMVLGGGDNAYGAAATLCGVAAEVHLVHRRRSRAQAWIQAEVRALADEGRLQLWPEHHLQEMRLGPARALIANASGRPVERSVDRVLCLLGYRPNTEAIARLLLPLGHLQRTIDGYLTVDASGRTSLPRVYAAGDVANAEHPCVATAVAMGSVAARTIERDLRSARP
jgi:thioredoxin reductase